LISSINTTYTLLADFFSKKGLKLGLSNIQKMDALFDHPSKRFPTIHVGGTNGKGSVTTKIASALALKNKRVGLYTSPHLSTFRERIQINGSIIEEQEALSGLLSIVERLEEMEIKATFFECMTLLAFLTFAKEEVDVAVIEVGLGGRFDATISFAPFSQSLPLFNWITQDFWVKLWRKLLLRKLESLKKKLLF
jgi:dihydrofolate synthase/folylpolyglutamate synthase